MITLRRTLLLSPALLVAPACAQPGPLPVVASFSILADMAAQIGATDISVASLVPAGADPHTFQPRPSDLVLLKGAAVVIENGLGLEGWLARTVAAAGFRGVLVAAAAGVRTRQADPHVWQDPRLAVQMVDAIAQGLASAAPPRAAGFHARAQTFRAAILEADAAIERQIAAVPPAKRRIITSHDAFGYYGARYGITFRAVQGINTDAEPSARDVAQLIAQIRREGIRAVFVENMTNRRLIQALARESGAVVGGTVYSDSLSPPGGPATTYLDMLRRNTDLFVAAMLAQ